MCIVCIKPSGVKRPTKEQFINMTTANPDGFGFVTCTKKGLQVRKTMDPKQYLQWVEQIDDAQPVIYHCRIATHGSIGKNNCHPFLSTDKQWAFAHNGVLTIQNEGDWTDSETFFRRIAEPLLRAGYAPNDKGTFDAMVEALIGSSKFAFMDSHGSVYSYGHFLEDNGLFFSNSSYQSYDDYGFLFRGVGSSVGKKKKKAKKTDIFEDIEPLDIVYDDCEQTYYDLVSRLYDDMTNDWSVWERSMTELYDTYAAEYPVSWDTFYDAYNEAENLLCQETNVEL